MFFNSSRPVILIVALGAAVLGASTAAADEPAGIASRAPQITAADALALTQAIDDQGALHLAITYPSPTGTAAIRHVFDHEENQAALDLPTCVLETKVHKAKDGVAVLDYRSVIRLGDVTRVVLMPMSQFASLKSLDQPASSDRVIVDPDIFTVVFRLQENSMMGVFLFRNQTAASRFVQVLDRVVPQCGGKLG